MRRICPGWVKGVHPTINGITVPRYLGQAGLDDPDYQKRKHEETTALCDDCLKALKETVDA